ncbi:MAG: signal peptidase I [Dehalococcoidia bacterium]
MTPNKEIDDERPEREKREAEAEHRPLPEYDPLTSPWGESSAIPYPPQKAEIDPIFGPEWPPAGSAGLGEPPAWEAAPGSAPGLQRHLGVWPPAGSQGPYGQAEEPRDWQRERTTPASRPRGRWAITTREVVETLLLALLIFLAVRTSLQNFRVEGASMMPSLENGEYLIVNKLAYAEIDLSLFNWLPFFDAGDNPVHHLWDSPGRGDVIVFLSPRDAARGVERDFVKRIIGVPGDTITIASEGGQVLVNGLLVEEPYIQGSTRCNRNCGPWEIPLANTAESIAACGSSACYFVMGDNRQNSSDSRQGWLVPEENIIGKALITYWGDGGPALNLAPNRSIKLSDEAAAAGE